MWSATRSIGRLLRPCQGAVVDLPGPGPVRCGFGTLALTFVYPSSACEANAEAPPCPGLPSFGMLTLRGEKFERVSVALLEKSLGPLGSKFTVLENRDVAHV